MENTLAFGVRNLKIETTDEWFSIQWSEGFGSGNSIMLCVWMEREKQRWKEELIKYQTYTNVLQYVNSRNEWQLLQEKRER